MKITASVDDGCDLDVKFVKLCEKYNIPCTVYLPVDIIGLAMRNRYAPLTPQHEEYLIRNHEIGSHGITHRLLTRIPIDEARDEIVNSKFLLENKYGLKITKFCYPRGYANPQIKRIVENAGYESARTTLIGHTGSHEDEYLQQTAVHVGCPVREEYAGTTWQNYGLKLALKAKEESAEFHLWGHSWEIEKYGQWKELAQFLKQVKAL